MMGFMASEAEATSLPGFASPKSRSLTTPSGAIRDIGGLEIPMNITLFAGRFESGRDPAGVANRGLDG